MPRNPIKHSLNTSAAALLNPVAALKDSAAALPLGGVKAGGLDLAGDSASAGALAKLDRALTELKALQVAPFLQRAVACIRAADAPGAAEWALKALNIDERSGPAWRLLGMAREKLGDFSSAIKCFESAIALSPEDTEIANDIGRLAYRLDMKDVATKLFVHYCQAHPESPDGPNNLACVLRDANRYEEAIDVLKEALGKHPSHPLLWNTLGSVLNEQGNPAMAITFFEEALRLNPHFVKARYNRGNAKLALADFDGALDDCESAMAKADAPDEIAMMRMARSTILLCRGEVGKGWDEYEVRFDPNFAGVSYFMIDRPKWTPDAALSGKSLLLVGEQGLGDEVLFANTVPDVLNALGPKGKLAISVEPRLVNLFKRSFPTAEIHGHSTLKVNLHLVRGIPGVDLDAVDLWAPIGSLLTRFRRSVDAFPTRERFLIPDESRVAHWREVLMTAPTGPKVGILWKSMKLTGARRKQFSAFEQWAPVLTTPGVSFINLQYGDCAEELALAREQLGVEIWTPPSIDLKADLDDLAALTCALDLTIGFANATSNIAAASGGNVWMISSPGAWTQMGSGRYPWYPQVRAFNPPGYDNWNPVMEEIAGALRSAF